MKRIQKPKKVIQTGAFVAGIAAGAAIAFIIAPVGLTLVVGLVVAGTAAVIMDQLAQDFITRGYDAWAK